MKYIPIVVFIFQFQLLFSQKEVERQSFLDIGINITSVLSSFSGNGNFLDATEVPLIIRIGRKRVKLRLGVGASGNSSDFIDPISGAFRESINQTYVGRVGLEYHFHLTQKWQFYIGADLNGLYNLREIDVFSPQSGFNRDREYGVGGGPLMGIRFNISDRIYLSTETTMYGQYINTEVTSSFSPNATSTNRWNFEISPPLFLYFNYSF